MNRLTDRFVPVMLLGAVLLTVGSVVTYSILASNRLSEGPVDLIWDKTACAACGMHVGEPPFAAQLTTKTGETLAFDDPGCLFHYVEEHGPDVHAIWFHHVREDRWIAAAEVAFTAIEPTPMGFGIGAVDAGTAAAIDLEGARRRCLGANAGADAPAATKGGQR
ncbi:MAG: hypothetical protein KDC98_11630 [Planctomycetes bacterium]|nr:hypothetical protein [Planctomycetota bacterium]